MCDSSANRFRCPQDQGPEAAVRGQCGHRRTRAVHPRPCWPSPARWRIRRRAAVHGWIGAGRPNPTTRSRGGRRPRRCSSLTGTPFRGTSAGPACQPPSHRPFQATARHVGAARSHHVRVPVRQDCARLADAAPSRAGGWKLALRCVHRMRLGQVARGAAAEVLGQSQRVLSQVRLQLAGAAVLHHNTEARLLCAYRNGEPSSRRAGPWLSARTSCCGTCRRPPMCWRRSCPRTNAAFARHTDARSIPQVLVALRAMPVPSALGDSLGGAATLLEALPLGPVLTSNADEQSADTQIAMLHHACITRLPAVRPAPTGRRHSPRTAAGAVPGAQQRCACAFGRVRRPAEGTCCTAAHSGPGTTCAACI